MSDCAHDDRFHIMGAKNGCLACHSEEQQVEIERLTNKLNTDSQEFEIKCHKATIERLTKENATLEGDNVDLKNSLLIAQNENKQLRAELSEARRELALRPMTIMYGATEAGGGNDG